MGKLVQFVTSLHTSTKREYLDRMVKPKNMKKIIGMEIEDLVTGVINIFLEDGNQ